MQQQINSINCIDKQRNQNTFDLHNHILSTQKYWGAKWKTDKHTHTHKSMKKLCNDKF